MTRRNDRVYDGFKVIKRDNTLEDFSIDKVVNAIKKAFFSNGVDLTDDMIDELLASIEIEDNMEVEDIQDQIEDSLMENGYYDVAKSFIKYRQDHADERNTMDKLKFLMDYCNAENAATGSKFDANANVEAKNIATLIGELPKQDFIKLNRRMLTNKLKELYGKEFSDKYINLLNNHFIYKNDETSLANYCASITMYPWLLEGTMSIGGNSKAPTNLKSFCGGFINMVFMVSSMLSGACATPEFLMYMDYFIRKEYGDDYYLSPDKVVDLSIKQRSLDKVICDCFEQIVYSINQPTGARNFQAVFWNVAYYDEFYFKSLFGEFFFPDGTQPKWESLKWLQKRFMKWFNKERTKTVLTFPVETMALLSDGDDFRDKDMADFTAEMYSEGHSFFTYVSDNADSLSSCCFADYTKVVWKNDEYGTKLTSLKEMYDTVGDNYVQVIHNGEWISAKPVKLPNRKMYKVTTENKKEYVVSDNHIHLTLTGEKQTSDLSTKDFLMFSTKELPATSETNYNYSDGSAVSLFVKYGQFIEDGVLYTIPVNEYDDMMNQMSESTGSSYVHIFDNLSMDGLMIYDDMDENEENHVLTIISQDFKQFIIDWTMNQEENVEINTNCINESTDFRKGILDNISQDERFSDIVDALYQSLGIAVTNGASWVKNRTTNVYYRITNIEECDYDRDIYCVECENQDKPYFTLGDGLMTHNCRLRNEIQDNGFSYTLGAGGVSTGSKSVLTINLNRAVQYAVKNNMNYLAYLEDIIDLMHKVQIAYNENLKLLLEKHMLPLFDAGYINIARQYLTIGVNGMVEAAQFMGLQITDNPDYEKFVSDILSIVEKLNKKYRTKELMFNCEMIPAENVGVKHAKWDREAGYETFRDCYNSYFYIVEDTSLNVIDKIRLHGKRYIEHLTGGSALHMNMEEHLSKDQYRQILKIASKEGCNYFTFNIPNTICNDCGHIDKRYLKECPHCHSTNVDYLTRIIGYMKRVSNFSKPRQKEASIRYYLNATDEI